MKHLLYNIINKIKNMSSKKTTTVYDQPWEIVFPRKLLNKLNKLLFSTAPNENGCYLIASSYKTKNKSVIQVQEIIESTESS